MHSAVLLSDTHLNRLPWFFKKKFVKNVKSSDADCMFLTGDISTAKTLIKDMSWLSRSFQELQIYFVIGNHDMHKKSFLWARDALGDLLSKHGNLHWMTHSDIIELNQNTCVIGHEGWYDASHGDPSLLKYTLDWLWIEELSAIQSHDLRIDAFRNLAIDSANIIESKLTSACQQYKNVNVLTHFPPWIEATTIPGTKFEQFWLPYSVNHVLGQTIREVSKKFASNNITVMCGHTHVYREVQIEHNLKCIVSQSTRLGKCKTIHF